VRSGAQTLLLLAAPLNVAILRALAEGPQPQTELRKAAGSPAQTTLRTYLNNLVETGAIVRRRRDRFPGRIEFELTPAGHNLLVVRDTLQRWVHIASRERPELDGSAAGVAVKALAEAWSTPMLRALAASPLTLTELDRLITSLSYPTLERRLGTMRLTGLIESRGRQNGGTPYAATELLRRGVAPLLSATHWELRHHFHATPALGVRDFETIFLLAVPLLRPSQHLSGTCKLAVEVSSGGGSRLAGVVVAVRDSRVVSCSTRLEGLADGWVMGPPAAWLDAIISADQDGLELGGNSGLSHALIDDLHRIVSP
jgi:DNA-binding HxlR family transcriptional regulator